MVIFSKILKQIFQYHHKWEEAGPDLDHIWPLIDHNHTLASDNCEVPSLGYSIKLVQENTPQGK